MRTLLVVLVVALGGSAMLGAAVASAATFTVDSNADPGVGACDPGECTLREAITLANSTAGPDRITFTLPDGATTIALASTLPAITEQVEIDGSTQPGYAGSPVVEIDATRVTLDAFDVTGGSGTVFRALSVGGSPFVDIGLAGDGGNVVEGSYIGLAPDGSVIGTGGRGFGIELRSARNVIGGTTPAQRNVISANGLGISGQGSPAITGNVIVGNFIGTDPTGAAPAPVRQSTGIATFGANTTIGGSAPGAGNVISGNFEALDFNASGGVIEGNRIGTSADGMHAIPGGVNGLLVTGSNNRIGGTTPAQRNVISGLQSFPLQFADFYGLGAGSNDVLGNYFGVAADGQTALPNGSAAVTVQSGNGNRIGGTAPGAGNLIAHNGGGVNMRGGTHTAVRANRMFANFGIGIDLGVDGPTPNDPGDADTGVNGLQNAPVVTSVTGNASATTISGTLDSTPGVYQIDLFTTSAAAGCAPPGVGQTYLGTVEAASGTFTADVAPVAPGDLVTATATSADGDTSEFSACTTAAGAAPSADLSVSQTVSPMRVDAGQPVTYTITAHNAGPDGATGVIVGAQYGPSTFVSASAGCDAGERVVCRIASLPSGASQTFQVTVRPDRLAFGAGPTEPGTNQDVATISGDQADPDPSNDSDTITVQVDPASDVSLTQAVAPATPVAGDQVTYTYGISSTGPNDASGATLRVHLPAGLSFVSADPDCSFDAPSAQVTCDVGDVFANDIELTRTISVRTDRAGTLAPTTAQVSAAQTDPDTTNNAVSDALTVDSPPPPQADVSLSAHAPAPATPVVGDNVTYSWTVTDAGPADASGVALAIDLPAGLTFVSGDPGCTSVAGGARCAIGALASGGSADRSIVVRATQAGTLAATRATVSADQADPVTSNNAQSSTLTVAPPPPPRADLSVTQTDSPDPVVNGRNVDYTLTVRNTGPDQATGVVLTDDLGGQPTFRSASPGCTLTGAKVTCAIGTLGPNTMKQVVVTVTAARPGAAPADAVSISSTARVSGDQVDPNAANNQSTEATVVEPAANLSLTQTASPAQPTVGDLVTFTYGVTNSGPDGATAVRVVASLPDGLTFVSGDPGCTGSGTSVTCAIGDMTANGTPVQRSFTTRSTRAGTLTPTTATVAGAQTDPVPAGNSQLQPLTVNPATTTAGVPAATPPAQTTPPPGGGGSTPPPSNNNPPSQTSPPVPPPVAGQTVNAAPVSGTVLIKVNGKFVPLTAGQSIPFGSTVDARHGVVTITAAIDAAGHTQSANFGEGMFTLKAVYDPDLITELDLAGGNFADCPTATGAKSAGARRATARAAAARQVASTVKRKLWGDGHGRFRTKGRVGAATVRGTRWTTEDRCDGTKVSVQRGLVAVRDIPKRKTVLVPAGKSYVAAAPKAKAGSARKKK
jgi:uncharacterized repeat protein (TIGR01451 family)/CSLREA domain-containing protein